MENNNRQKQTYQTNTRVTPIASVNRSGESSGRNPSDNEAGVAEANAFRRTTKTLRSPVVSEALSHETRSQIQGEKQIEEREVENVSPAINKQTAFCRLGEKIRSLVEMLEDGKRRSIHQPVRDAIESIKALYELAAIERGDEKAKSVIRKSSSSQTSPWLKHKPDPKRKLEGAILTPNSKRSNSNKSGKGMQQAIATPSAQLKVTEKVDDTQWRTVVKKTKPKDNRTKRVRPDAIVIEAKGETSYAEILKSVKADPKFGELDEVVSKIRRTHKGEMPIQLSKTGEQTKEFTSILGDTLGERVSVRSLTQKKVLECKDIDEVTTKEDIERAICGQFDIAASTLEVMSMRKAFGGTQVAVLRLSEAEANKLLTVGRVKVGWVNCRIRERIQLTRCYKCLEFGHIRRDCRSKEDRSKQCRKCGGEDHIAKDCNKDPECMLCKTKEGVNAQHVAGSGRCPVFRRAMSVQRK